MSLECTSTRAAVRRLAYHFKPKYPNAVACLRHDLNARASVTNSPISEKALQTTNAIERRFRKVRRRTRPMDIPGHDLNGPHPVRKSSLTKTNHRVSEAFSY
jgi:transposase-like protein